MGILSRIFGGTVSAKPTRVVRTRVILPTRTTTAGVVAKPVQVNTLANGSVAFEADPFIPTPVVTPKPPEEMTDPEIKAYVAARMLPRPEPSSGIQAVVDAIRKNGYDVPSPAGYPANPQVCVDMEEVYKQLTGDAKNYIYYNWFWGGNPGDTQGFIPFTNIWVGVDPATGRTRGL